MSGRQGHALFWTVLGAAVLLRMGLWWSGNLPFYADEAIVGLMARHILRGTRPLFFYGQAYMGALDAYLVALVFRVLGVSVAGIRMAQALLYAATMVVSLAWLRLRRGPLAARAGLFLFLFPPIGLLLYTAFSLGGYGEALLAGSLLLWGSEGLRSAASQASTRKFLALAVLWGLIAGLGIWCNPLTGVYVLGLFPFLVLPAWKQRRWLPLITGVAIGMLTGMQPYVWYVSRHGLAAVLADLSGHRVPLHPLLRNWGIRTWLLALSWLTVTPGIRPPWDFIFPGGPLAWFPLLGLFLTGKLGGRPGPWIRPLAAILAWNLLLWWATPFAGDPSGRYALPSMHAWVLLLAGWLAQVRSPRLRRALLAGFVGHSLIILLILTWGSRHLTPQFNPESRIDVRPLPQLVAFLEKQGLHTGYTNYWMAYPLAFLSREELIFAPRLPYHTDLRYTPLDDRIPAYTCRVARSRQITYITAGPARLDALLRQAFHARGITWEETVVAGYRIFHHLSRPVHPWELGLTPPPLCP